MQVEPIKPMLKAPRHKRLTLIYHKLLSSFAFKFNMRRYIKVTLGGYTSLTFGDTEKGDFRQGLTDRETYPERH